MHTSGSDKVVEVNLTIHSPIGVICHWPSANTSSWTIASEPVKFVRGVIAVLIPADVSCFKTAHS